MRKHLSWLQILFEPMPKVECVGVVGDNFRADVLQRATTAADILCIYIARAVGVAVFEIHSQTIGRHMPPLSDEDVGRQILGIFMRYKVPASGTLRRNNFFDVRDADFQRGLNRAVANKWIKLHLRDRYTYQLTDVGFAAGWKHEPAAEPQRTSSDQADRTGRPPL
jgi:hypothetical protein